MRTTALALVLAALALAGCSHHERTRKRVFGGVRPAELHTPQTLTPGKRYPLVVVVHGYGVNGIMQALYFQAAELADTDRALWIAPDGMKNVDGDRFWAARPDQQKPDDVAYLGTLIDDIAAEWPVDRNKVFVLGHSNGAFMAYRMALERADVVAGIMVLAGHTPAHAARPSRPVSVLHLHGSADEAVAYAKGDIGAVDDVTKVAAFDGCGTSRVPTVTLDLDRSVPGAETHGEAFTGCPSGVAVELWTLQGSHHVPALAPGLAARAFDWLDTHSHR